MGQFAALAVVQPSRRAPKLSRWFSWNAKAQAAFPEYHAQKMILECEFTGDEEDPDLGVPFDDLKGAATAQKQQRHFSALKAGGGGLKLCYKLMTSKLLEIARSCTL